MGTATAENEKTVRAQRALAAAEVIVKAVPRTAAGGMELQARKGEVVGLAGLAGHGQTRMLHQIFEAARRNAPDTTVKGSAAFIAGDRQADGIFNLWSIGANSTASALKGLIDRFLITPGRERKLAEEWKQRIGIRTPDVANNILTLSGGNQQKTLFARALSSPAQIVLMDDPMRGVDVGTKLEVYEIIRKEAESGRSFIWYTTEIDELSHCDRAYVFRNGRIVAELGHDELSEDKVLHASFAESA